MFTIYGLTGAQFKGTLEEWRQVKPVSGPARAHALRPVGQDRQQPLATRPDEDGDWQHHQALSAYSQTGQGDTQRHPLTRVGELMSASVLTLPHNTPLAQAWQWLAQQGLGQAPVLGDRHQLVGLLLRADLLQPGLLPGPGTDAAAWAALLAQPVSRLMWTPVPSVSPDADIRRVAALLLDTGLPGLPVLNDDGPVLGFISRSDILRAVVADPPLTLWA
jgi:CBS-domain-containing membrane protein